MPPSTVHIDLTIPGKTVAKGCGSRIVNLVRQAAHQKMDGRSLLDCPVSVFVSVFLPIPKRWAAEKRPIPKAELLVSDLDQKITDGLDGVVFRANACICDLRVKRSYGAKWLVKIEVRPWTLRFFDTSAICLEATQTEVLRKMHQRTAHNYRVRALHEITERRMVPAHIQIFTKELVIVWRKVGSGDEPVPCEERRDKFAYSFDALVDVDTGSIYRDGMCVTSNQLEIIAMTSPDKVSRTASSTCSAC